MRASSSIRYSPTSAACQLVPQAVRIMRLIPRSCCGVRFRPPNLAVPSSSLRRPRIDDETRIVAEQNDEPISSAELGQSVFDGGPQERKRLARWKLVLSRLHFGQAAGDQVSDDFGVG